MKLHLLSWFPVVIGLGLASCRQEKIKVIGSEWTKGSPRQIYYFDNEADARRLPVIHYNNGVGYVESPISFDYESYFSNGELAVRGRYVKGRTSGLWEYFYVTGIQQAKCYYLNGLAKDTVYCFYPSGKIKRFMVEIDTIKRQWRGIDYYRNGNKSYDIYLLNDGHDNWTVDGPWKEWFDDGAPRFQANFKNGWSVGKWQRWDSAGKVEEGEKSLQFAWN